MTELDKMMKGELYFSADEELQELRNNARNAFYSFNQSFENNKGFDLEILKNIFGKTGEGFFVEPGIKFDYGFNIEVGKNFFANYNLTILDSCKVTIGDNCMIAPNVSIYTATHPLDIKSRNSGYEFAKPVVIGDNVWIGGNVVILPGVTIGSGVVIEAGSVVVNDVLDNKLIAGNPAVVKKNITND